MIQRLRCKKPRMNGTIIRSNRKTIALQVKPDYKKSRLWLKTEGDLIMRRAFT